MRDRHLEMTWILFTGPLKADVMYAFEDVMYVLEDVMYALEDVMYAAMDVEYDERVASRLGKDL